MRLVLHLFSVYIFVTVINSSIYTNVKADVFSLIKRSFGQGKQNEKTIEFKHKANDKVETSTASPAWHNPNEIVLLKNKNVHPKRKYIPQKKQFMFDKGIYEKDLVLNLMSRRRNKLATDDSLSSESSSISMEHWKDTWKRYWTEKKFEAINSTLPRGDTVNMIGARPWGVPCGDPNQHDMPWGSCMLPMECEAEFRVYRGDIFCGRTQFICCALQITTYDMYQGFDMSFEDSMLATSSEEKRERERGSKENKKRRRRKDRRKRQRDRQKRKRKLKRTIRKISKEISKMLSKMYRNGTTTRKKKTKQLKKFIDMLKKQYKKDRHAVKKIHGETLKDIDAALQTRIDQIRIMNKDFSRNSTFRDIIVNGTVNKEMARMLLLNYPELSNALNSRRTNDYDKPKDLNYDIEYGLLYY